MIKIKSMICLFLIFQVGTALSQNEDRWYSISLGGTDVGYLHEKVSNEKDQIITTVNMKMGISRLGASAEIASSLSQRETTDQGLLSIDSELDVSNDRKFTRVEIKRDTLEIIQNSEGKDHLRKIHYTGKLIGMDNLRSLANQELKVPGDSLLFKTYFAELDMVLNGVYKFIQWEDIAVGGQNKRVRVFEETYEEYPVRKRKWVDGNGYLIKSTEPNPFGEMQVLLTDRISALKAVSESSELPEDQYGATMAISNIRLPQARSISAMTIRIRHLKPDLGFPDLSGDYQKVIEKGKDYVILEINPYNHPDQPVPDPGSEFLPPMPFWTIVIP